METLGCFEGICRVRKGLYWGIYWDSGKENGDYYL